MQERDSHDLQRTGRRVDSGLGGISVVRQIRTDLPHERILYFGDSANAPYGTKTPEQVRDLSFRIVEDFVEQGAKAVVIACNTATSSAVQELREHYDIPIIGMEPALKVACDRGHGERQSVIVAATPLTLRERKFAALMHRFEDAHTIHKQPCPRLVEIVERGELDDHDLVMRTLHDYFDQYDSPTPTRWCSVARISCSTGTISASCCRTTSRSSMATRALHAIWRSCSNPSANSPPRNRTAALSCAIPTRASV